MADFVVVENLKNTISSNLLHPGKSIFHGVGVGWRKNSDERCVLIYLTPDKVANINEIKKQIDIYITDKNIPIEFVIAPKPKFASNPSPLVAGVSTGCQFAQTSGTIGYFCTSIKKIGKKQTEPGVFILSCNHIFANTDVDVVGVRNSLEDGNPNTPEPIYHPSSLINSSPTTIGILHRVGTLLTVQLGSDYENEIDAAIAKLNTTNYKLEIKQIGKVTGTMSMNEIKTKSKNDILNQVTLSKFGANTSYTEGIFFDLSHDVLFDWFNNSKNFNFKFINQFFIKPTVQYPKFADGGDSGSLVVNRESASKIRAVGLLFAKENESQVWSDLRGLPENVQIIHSFALANRIDRVLAKLQIALL